MMYGSKWVESGRDAVIKVDDISFEAFELIKSYVYGSNANITVKNCISLYYAAKKYMIENLSQIVEKYILSHVDGQNVLHLLNECKRYHLSKEVSPKLMDSITMDRQTCDKILKSNGFLNSSPGM